MYLVKIYPRVRTVSKMILALIICTVCIVVLRIWYKIYVGDSHAKLKNFHKFPYRDLPLIGHAYRYVLHTDKQLINSLFNDLKTMTKSTIMWIFGKPVVILTNPDDIHMFLTSPAASQKGSAFQVLYGNQTALLTAHMQIWKPLRRHMNPIFSVSSIKHFIKNFNEASKILVKDLEEYCDKGDFDITRSIGVCSTNIALRSHANRNVDDTNLLAEIYEKIDQLLNEYGHQMLRFYLYNCVKIFNKVFNISGRELKLINQIIQKLGVKINDEVKSALDDHDDNNVSYFYKRLAHVLQIGLLDESDIKEQVGFFFTAAANTASVATSGTILLIAMHPEIQETLYAELHNALQTNYIDQNSLNKLPYLDRVIKEGLRLMPGVPIINRKPYKDDVDLGDRIIPANTDVIISIYNLHRNRAYWGDDAEKFNPDHFLPENVAGRSRYCYIPFAHGERHCIAIKYASLHLKVIIAHLILKYKFSTKLKLNELKLSFALSLKILNGAMVSITKRDVPTKCCK